MEENKGLLLYGCNLAKDLEHNLPNLADKPDRVLTSCEEIIMVFSIVKERTISVMQHHQQRPREIGIGTTSSVVQEWPSHYYYNAESVKAKELLQQPSSSGLVVGFNTGREFSGGSLSSEAVGGIKAFMNVLDSNRASSSWKAKRKRKDEGDEGRIVKMVAAPRMGNLEHPPEDGYTWKKYGQKEILGTKYPRSYYKCTHQKLFQCPAKKHVQRLNYDPFTFEVTYIGSHSCTTMLSTTIQPPSTTAVPPLVDFPGSSNTTNPMRMTTSSTMQLFQDHHQVVDMADALFNSGGTVSNTMDFIFHSRDSDKWDDPNNQENKKD